MTLPATLPPIWVELREFADAKPAVTKKFSIVSVIASNKCPSCGAHICLTTRNRRTSEAFCIGSAAACKVACGWRLALELGERE